MGCTVDEVLDDQAAGLRRLLARNPVRVVTLASGREGVGKTSDVLNLAVALAKRGRNVMVLDENPEERNLSHFLGLPSHYDLLQVMRREKTLEEVTQHGPEDIGIVSAARGVRELASLDDDGREWLVHSFTQFSRTPDVILVDALAGAEKNMLSLSLAAQEIVVAVSSQPASITDAYALIKVLSQQYGRRRFRILVNKVGAEDARAIFGNMAHAAKRFLKVTLDLMGHVPLDEKLGQSSRLGRSVVEAFPETASAANFRQLAEVLEQWPCPKDDTGQLRGFMQRLIHSSRVAAEGLSSGMS